jgi:hypothetical protein
MESGASDGAASNQMTIDIIASFLHGCVTQGSSQSVSQFEAKQEA